MPKVNISTRQPDVLRGKLLLVSIDSWEAAHRFPSGHYVRSLGAVGDKDAESEPHGQSARLGRAPARSLCLLGARLAALRSSALPA